MKKRFFKASKKYLIILGILITYLIWILITDIKIPCLIYQLTSYKCFACGLTRMCLSLLRFDFKTAFYCNPYLFITLPLLGALIIYHEIYFIKNGSYKLGFTKYLLYAFCVGLLVFGVLRNA